MTCGSCDRGACLCISRGQLHKWDHIGMAKFMPVINQREVEVRATRSIIGHRFGQYGVSADCDPFVRIEKGLLVK